MFTRIPFGTFSNILWIVQKSPISSVFIIRMINIITYTCLFFISEAFISRPTVPFCFLFQMLMLWSTFINNQPLFWEISIIAAEIYHSAFPSLNMPVLMSDWDSGAIHSDIKLMERTLPGILLRELGKCVLFLYFYIDS